MLPNQLLYDPEVGKGELLVFWVLTTHLFRGKEYCFPSLRTIQKEARISRPTIIKAIRVLGEKGYLKKMPTEKGKVNKYQLIVRVVK